MGAYQKAATFADLRGCTVREAAERLFALGNLHWDEVEDVYAALEAQAKAETKPGASRSDGPPGAAER